MNRFKKNIFLPPPILLAAILIVLIISAAPGQRAQAVDIDGRLTVRLQIIPKSSTGGQIKLCFSKPSNCISMSKTGPDHYEHVFFDNGDHPFVDHPDDWDNLYLTLDSGYTTLQAIFVEYAKIEYVDSTIDVNRAFTYVDWQAPGGKRSYRFVSPSLNLDLSQDIKFNRQKLLVENGMGLGGLTDNQIRTEFNSLPENVKSGAFDIGQSGLWKYGWFESDTQSGCDEFACWHYVNTSLTDATNILDSDVFSYNPDATPSHYVCDGYFGPEQGFKEHNRLALVTWNYDINWNRTAINKILRVDPIIGTDDPDTWEPTNIEYQPKIGDVFFRYANCPDDSTKTKLPANVSEDGEKGGAFHAMILLDEIIGPDVYECSVSDWDGCLNARVIEGSTFVYARRRQIIEVNERCPNCEFWYDLYVAELK